MSRNTEGRFAINPTNINISRSIFDRSSSLKTSFNVGDLVPFYVDEVLPGDTFDISTSKVIRMQTLITPVMDNLYLDTYYFFVPNRLVWSHWKEFNGENTESAWLPQTEYEIPQVTAPANTGWSSGTIADYMGVPTGVAGLSINALPFRAYALIVNEWFRDQNLQDPVDIPVDEITVAGVNTGNYITDLYKGGKPFVCAKYHDYFTSCLPSPQKGPDVTIAIGDSVPVIPGSTLNESTLDLKWATVGSTPPSYTDTNRRGVAVYSDGTADGSYTGLANTPSDSPGRIYPANLSADLSGLTIATVNQLRMAFQIQKLYERDARGGTRYVEILKSHFGVTSPDSRQQRPEYLGGNRVPINIDQVVQTSNSADGVTPQGNVTGYSQTNDSHNDFTKSFTEHGFIIGLMVARYDHTYQQGLERFWSRKDRFDFYWPVLANIGEQPVLNKEIYAQGTEVDNEVFGYQEAWADYRYKPNKCTGEMRSTHTTSLDSWHFGDDYSSLPHLSASWIMEDKSNVDRTLAVTSSVSNQLFGDIYIKNRTTRPMPMYSIPGMIDHN